MNLREPNPPHGNNDWPSSEIDLLRQLSGEGYTAAQMRARFPGRSRNAIIGKLHRLGLKSKTTFATAGNKSFWDFGKRLRELAGFVQSPLGYSQPQIAAHFGIGSTMLQRGLAKLQSEGDRIKPLKTNMKSNGAELAPKRVRKRGPITQTTVADAPRIVPEPEPIPATAVFIWELAKNSCRWPVVGEGAETKFCGAIALVERPYCARHSRMAYATPSRVVAPLRF